MTKKKPKYVIAIGMPKARGTHPLTERCLHAALANLRKDPYVSVHLFDPVGYQIDNARNLIAYEALNVVRDLTHIMWIDDDMTFEPDAIRRLLAHDLPIVGGLCFNRRPPYAPVLVNFTERGFAFDYDYTEGLNQYDSTGAAFLLTKKEVYLKIREKHAEGPFSIIGVGEDVSFCKRAASVGFKIMVDTTVKIGHVSPDVVIDEKTAARLRDFRSNPYFPRLPMPGGDPVASVIVPTWNQNPEWLKIAIDSALRQTVPVEVIVVDDGSTPEITMKDLGWLGHVPGISDSRFDHVRIKRTEHRGCFPALNTGIDLMTTEFFTWLSSDDLFYPPKIARQIDAMMKMNSPACYHSYDVMVEEGHVHETVFIPIGWRTPEEQRKHLGTGCIINGLTTMVHKSLLDKLRLPNGDYFDTSFTISSDWELWNRIGNETVWLGINDILATRRQYREQVMCASQRYARDPKKVKVWIAEDAKIREKYGPKEQ